MIFNMPTCGGCRTCEMACSFKHRGWFIPAISSIKILDRKDGPGFLVFLAKEPGRQEMPCDGCEAFDVPMCMQYCRESEDLKGILEKFMERSERNREEKRTAIQATGKAI